jgi:acyl carrier protein
LQTVFQEVFDDPTLEIRPETCPATIPDWDSIAQVKLVLAVEESFGVRLQDEDLGSFRSAGDFLQALCRN